MLGAYGDSPPEGLDEVVLLVVMTLEGLTQFFDLAPGVPRQDEKQVPVVVLAPEGPSGGSVSIGFSGGQTAAFSD